MSADNTSIASFLESKLRNFRAFLLAKGRPDMPQLEAIQQFDSVEDVMPYLNQLVVMNKAGLLDNAVAGICERLELVGDDWARVRAYLDCFVDCLTAQDSKR